MQKIHFTTTIGVSKEKVWETLWDLDAYRCWTQVFSENSNVQTDNWKEGSKLYFVDGNGAGMVSEVAVNRPYEYMSFRHLGMLDKGIEDTTSDAVKVWAGSTENYSLEEENGSTRLSVDMDISEKYKAMFEKLWPLALDKIKALAEGTLKTGITVAATIQAPVKKVWDSWTLPEHITQWNQASDDWHCPRAANDVQTGGSFSFTMAARDGSFSFDFGGVHDDVVPLVSIASTMADGRKMKVQFEDAGGTTRVTEWFEAENMHSLEMQRSGWQSILNNFKKYTETL